LDLRPSVRPQTHEPGRSRRQSDPSPQSKFRALPISLPSHLRGNTAPPYTVKKIQRLPGALLVKCGFHATDVSNGGNQTPGWPRYSTVDGLNDWFTKPAVSPFPPCSGCDIVRSWCEGLGRADAGLMRMSAEQAVIRQSGHWGAWGIGKQNPGAGSCAALLPLHSA
jgi:hypothetical protein